MPSAYVIDRQNGIVAVVASGRITPEEAFACFDTVVADPDFQPGMDVLSDHRELMTVLNPGFVKVFIDRVDRAGEMLRGSRIAFVESGSARYGMARMASLLSESTSTELRAFRDIEEARRWLAEEGDQDNT